jgi:hypothetical protein
MSWFSRTYFALQTGNARTSFEPLNFITSDPLYSDYRPAIDTSAQWIVFERTPLGGKITTLYLVALDGSGLRRFMRPGRQAMNTGPSQTRPDWSWSSGQVAMNVAATDETEGEALIAAGDGTPLMNVPFSKGYVYPTWTPNAKQLIVMNSSARARPRPSTSLVAPEGKIVELNLNGYDAAGTPVYGGFASPAPNNATNIVFAGQPVLDGWAGNSGAEYNQDYNYVFVNSKTSNVYVSAPLEQGASVTTYDPAHQGRAPVWSPDGKYVAFESDRAGGYAIFLANAQAQSAPVQVTDARYEAQHAKFFPDGKRLVVTALQVPGGKGPRGIAWVDVSGLVG